jgi:hypothetical protein
MTDSTDACDAVSADAVPRYPRRRLGLAVAVFGVFGLILLVASEAGPPWVDGFASAGAAVTAMVVLLAAELRWAELVTMAESAGLVAGSAPVQA